MELGSRKQLEEIQFRRAKETLHYVYNNSPFYKRKFDECGFDVGVFDSLSDFIRLPFTTKDDVRTAGFPFGGDFLCVPKRDLRLIHMTSGTTGNPMTGPYTTRDVENWTNLMARTYVAAGVIPEDVIMNVYGYGLFTGGMGFHSAAELIGACVIPWSVGKTEGLVKAMKDLGATVMTGTPSYQLYILETAIKMGLDPAKDFDLRVSMPGAEIWDEGMRRRIEEGYGLRAKGGGSRNVYGATELLGPGSGQECEYENGFHFWTDHFYLEVVDPETNELVGPGEQGEMVVTTLTKEALPLIRYRLRDLTVLEEGDCACGRDAFPRCMWVTGRVDDVIHYRGAKVWPSAIQQAILKFPEVNDYLVEVDRTGSGGFQINVEIRSGSDEPDLRERITNELRRVFIFFEPKINFVKDSTLPRYEGKSKRVIVK